MESLRTRQEKAEKRGPPLDPLSTELRAIGATNRSLMNQPSAHRALIDIGMYPRGRARVAETGGEGSDGVRLSAEWNTGVAPFFWVYPTWLWGFHLRLPPGLRDAGSSPWVTITNRKNK